MFRILHRGRTLFISSNNSCQLQVFSKFHLSNKVYQTSEVSTQHVKKGYEHTRETGKASKKINASSLTLLIIPIASFGLGVWQIKRKIWKEGIIAELKQRTNQAPVALPDNLDDLKDMEYCPVTVKGKFHHERELYMGPRSLIKEGGNTSGADPPGKVGYLIITPFELSGSGKTILVNRGWVPTEKYKIRRRNIVNDITGEVELTGLVRLHEPRPPLGIRNSPESRLFVYRDLSKMAEIAETEPVLVDALASSTVPGGPIGGQSIVSVRNEHLSYVFTWFGLSAATGVLWYLKYVRYPHWM